MILRSLALAASALILLSSCTELPGNGGSGRPYLAGLGVTSPAPSGFSNPAEAASFWDGDTIHGTARIRINRSEQRAYFYKDDYLVGVSPISTGNEENTTPPGTFKVTEMGIDHESSVYGIIRDLATGEVVNNNADLRIDKPGPGQEFIHAPMPFFLRFNYGIGMHAGYLPGYPASHGCVRMPKQMAAKFFENAQVGTPVIVE
jgi:lipoprotein-anchoring transpeptidase ErfK/SrfK